MIAPNGDMHYISQHKRLFALKINICAPEFKNVRTHEKVKPFHHHAFHGWESFFCNYRDEILLTIQELDLAGSSWQGVGTVHASSNIAASLWVIDNMCTPRIGCLLSPSNSGTARVTGPEIAAKPVAHAWIPANILPASFWKFTSPILPQSTPRNSRRTHSRY